MISNLSKLWAKFSEAARNSKCDAKLYSQPGVAILTGRTPVIEAVVRTAVEDSGIPMDWHYVGGRGIVRSAGDPALCRKALYYALVKSDLSQNDL